MKTRLTLPLSALALLGLAITCSWGQEQLEPRPPKRGRYIPELHGATGWYMPDDSGKYRHEHNPYDGGYGDRGQPYSADLRSIFRKAEEQLAASVQEANENFALGPRDHLRFMIDFNYKGTGWQIIQFEWVRDGDDTHPDMKKYSYVNENKLWETGTEKATGVAEQPYHYHQPDEGSEVSCEPPVEVSEEQQQQQHEAQPQSNINSEQDPEKIHETINEVLEYIQQRILPTLR
ncbi:uncharacterized protein [Drosophila pseudoobscura]|uniref:Uncharacterized protein n=1 Tax=Drosophila pseudoobscura pseudoobscura TaxID=46245 RepID=A0A6I8UTZ5_DROPS|nr:uncharacterized protein LOC4804271 [Drosophila pseudoobscura]